jgi:hypothetical protein
MNKINVTLKNLIVGNIDIEEAETAILSLLPENPMEIQKFNDEYSDPNDNRDLIYREGLLKAWEIAREELAK